MAGQTPKCSTISVYPTMGWITSRSAARHSKRPSRSMIRTYSRRKRGRFSRNCHESGRNSHPIPLGCYSRSGPIKPLVSRRESLHNPACDTTSSLTGTYGIRCGRHGAFVGKYYTRQRNRTREKSGFLRKSQVFHNLIPLVIVHLLVGIAEPGIFWHRECSCSVSV